MTNYFNLRSSTSGIILTVHVFIIAALLSSLLVHSYQKDEQIRDKQGLEIKREFIKSRITDLFHDAYNAAKLIDFMQRHTNLNHFDSVANDILSETRFLKTIGIVSGEIVTNIYPIHGNEAALGHNVLRDPKINFGALKAIEDSMMYFTGPYQLKQGGFGIIGRLPRYKQNKYTGFSFVLLDWNYFIKEAGIQPNEHSSFEFLVTTHYPDGRFENFISNAENFQNTSAVFIEFPQSNLRVFIKYKFPKNYFLSFLPYYSIVIVVSALIAFALWYKLSENRRIKLLVNERSAQLSKSREDYKQLFDQAGDMIVISDLTGKIKDVNKRLCEFSGYAQEELMSMTIADIIVNEDSNDTPIQWECLNDKHTELLTRLIRTKNGEFKKVELNATKVGENEILGIARDKSEIEALHKRNTEIEKMFKAGFDNTSVGMAYTSPEGSWIYVNKALSKITGYSNEELIELSFQKISHPDDVQSGIDFIKKAQLNQADEYDSIKRYIHKNGSVIWLQIRVTAVRNEENQLQFLMALIEDITGKMKLENDLFEEKKFSDLVINAIPGILYVTNEKSEIIRISEKVSRVTKKSENEILGHQIVEFMDPSEHSKVLNQREQVFTKGKAENEYDYVTPNGVKKTFYVVNTVIDVEGGKGTLGIGIDITKMKNYERQLIKYQSAITSRNKELKFLNIASEFSMNQKLSINQMLLKIVNILPNAFQYSNRTFARIQYKDQEYVSHNFQTSDWLLKEKILESGKEVGEIEIFCTEPMLNKFEDPFLKEERHLMTTISKIICTGTEKRLSLYNLKSSEEKYRNLFENLPGTVSIWDPVTLELIEVNKAFTDLYERPRKELIGMSIKQMRPLEYHESIENFAKQIITGENYKSRNTWVHLTKTGKKIYMDITSLRIQYNGEIAVLAVGTNITNLVLSDEKQKELTSDIRRLKSNIETVRDEERLHLSREIHDDLGQKLTLMSLYLSILQNDISIGSANAHHDDSDLKKELDEQILRINQVISDSIHTVRNLSDSLRMGVLGTSGLIDAIQNQCYKTKDLYKLECECLIQKDLFKRTFRDSVAKEVYRIYQESLTNVIRHAEASKMIINLTLINGTFRMVIKDNGKGFVKKAMRKNSLGLLGMQERAFLINGKIDIESEKGKGVKVVFEIPEEILFEDR